MATRGYLKLAAPLGPRPGGTWIAIGDHRCRGLVEEGRPLRTRLRDLSLDLAELRVWGKGVSAARIEVPVSIMDGGPTILDALELEVQPAMEGASLWPADPLETNELAAQMPELVPVLSELLRERFEMEAGRDRVEPAEVDDENVERLRALGYMD